MSIIPKQPPYIFNSLIRKTIETAKNIKTEGGFRAGVKKTVKDDVCVKNPIVEPFMKKA